MGKVSTGSEDEQQFSCEKGKLFSVGGDFNSFSERMKNIISGVDDEDL